MVKRKRGEIIKRKGNNNFFYHNNLKFTHDSPFTLMHSHPKLSQTKGVKERKKRIKGVETS